MYVDQTRADRIVTGTCPHLLISICLWSCLIENNKITKDSFLIDRYYLLIILTHASEILSGYFYTVHVFENLKLTGCLNDVCIFKCESVSHVKSHSLQYKSFLNSECFPLDMCRIRLLRSFATKSYLLHFNSALNFLISKSLDLRTKSRLVRPFNFPK